MSEVVPAQFHRQRVATLSALAVSAALLLGLFWLHGFEETKEEKSFDARLEQAATNILLFARQDVQELNRAKQLNIPVVTLGSANEVIYLFQVWSTEGVLLLRSQTASATEPLTALAQPGLATRQVAGKQSRLFSLHDPVGALIVQVAEPLQDRHDNLMHYLVPLILTFFVVLSVTSFLLKRSFQTLDALTERMRKHNLLDIKPMQIEKPSKEMLPVIDAVNSLFLRAGNAITLEQRFTSMAAHELRTPWAGIRAQAQLARTAQSEEELQRCLQALIRGIDRSSHVFDQLVDLAKLESMGQDITERFQSVRVAKAFQQVLEETGHLAQSKEVTVVSQFPTDEVQGIDFILYLMLRNLVSNAILYTPKGGRVEVFTQEKDEHLILTVDDSGKGIPAAARDKAFERFNRLDQHGADGVGLGLSIVAQVVAMLRAKIQLLDSPLGGLRVQVTLNRTALENHFDPAI